MKNNFFTSGLLVLFFYAATIIGEVRCIYKMFTCNWEPIGKAEVFYTVGRFTGLGVIFGYFDIEDH